jgi:transcriptional regulator with XRE-family HTH domain
VPREKVTAKTVKAGERAPARRQKPAAPDQDGRSATAPTASNGARSTAVPGLGHRLRAQRLAAHMSLRQLARTLDVSASFVSQIENGRSQPSVATLYQICQVLDVSVDELFDAATEESTKTSRAPRASQKVPVAVPVDTESSKPSVAVSANASSPVVSIGERARLVLDSGVTWEKLSVSGEAAVDFMFVRYEAGGSSTPDGFVTRHTGMEYGYVLSGILEVTLGFENYTVGPQQSISFDSATPHRLANHGDTPVEAIWFVHGRRANHEH